MILILISSWQSWNCFGTIEISLIFTDTTSKSIFLPHSFKILHLPSSNNNNLSKNRNMYITLFSKVSMQEKRACAIWKSISLNWSRKMYMSICMFPRKDCTINEERIRDKNIGHKDISLNWLSKPHKEKWVKQSSSFSLTASIISPNWPFMSFSWSWNGRNT